MSNKIQTQRKQELRFLEGQLWGVELLKAMIGTVSDPKLIRKEIEALEATLNFRIGSLKNQLTAGKGGKDNDKLAEQSRPDRERYTVIPEFNKGTDKASD